MTDLPATPRFALPLLAIAQAQKETTHNEALALIDALVHAAVEDGPIADPPADPEPGACWIVAAGATDSWTGHTDRMALWTTGGWRFSQPRAGMALRRLSDGAILRYADGGWVEPATIANPAGGAIIDPEARSAIDALIEAIAEQGLVISV